MSRKALSAFFSYLMFFVLIGFVTYGNVSLFLNLLKNEMNLVYTRENIRFAAIFTFYNTVFVAGLFALFDKIRRKFFVEKPMNEILKVTKRITNGDFSVRIKTPGFGYFKTLTNDINTMAEELSGIETLRTDFTSNVSHELKTPLSVLQNYGYLLAEPDLTEEKRIEYAKSINRVTKHLSELVNNILKLSKLESQKILPDFKKCNLSNMILECLIGFENELDKKNIDLDVDVEEDIYIKTDSEMLSIVWTNLFSNAIKFSPDYGKIYITLKRNENSVTFSVSDTGCGMDKNTLKHIFDKFYQGDTSHSAKGNGLGLALVKKVIDILGGEIDVESIPGEGSLFTVKLNNVF